MRLCFLKSHTEKNRLVNRQKLVKKRLILRNKYRNHRSRANYDNWREVAKLTGESFENDQHQQRFLENVYKQKKQLTLIIL